MKVISTMHNSVVSEISQQTPPTITTIIRKPLSPQEERTSTYNAIQRYKYRPLSEVRKSSLDRKTKRIITYIKYKALGIIKPSKSDPKNIPLAPSLSPPTGLLPDHTYAVKAGVKPLYAIKQVKNEWQEDDYFALREDVKYIKDLVPDLSIHKYPGLSAGSVAQAQAMLKVYKQLGYNAVAVKTEMGAELPCNTLEEIELICKQRMIDEPQLRYTKLLPGGNPGHKGRRRKKKKHVNRKAKPQMVVGTQLGVRNPKNMMNNSPVIQDYWRYEEVFTTDGAGNLSVYLSLRNPLTAINGSGIYARAQDFAKLYDEFKVLSVGITIDFLYLNPVAGDVAVAVDYDSIPTGTYTFADLRDNQFLKIFSGTNQISYMAKVPKLSEGTYRERPAIIHQGGFYDFNTPPEEGGIVIAFERYTPGVRLVRITSSVKALMRRRRTLPTAEQRKTTSAK